MSKAGSALDQNLLDTETVPRPPSEGYKRFVHFWVYVSKPSFREELFGVGVNLRVVVQEVRRDSYRNLQVHSQHSYDRTKGYK